MAAAVTSIFALEIGHAAEEAVHDGDARASELTRLASEAEALVPLVFLVIVGTVALYGLGVGRVAERLGLASTSPQGVLFVGGRTWVVQAARRLEESGVPCLVVDREYGDLAAARQAGLTTVVTNILSDYAVRDMDLAGIGRLLAATDDDEVNSAAAREFVHVLGRPAVYQTRRADSGEGNGARRKATAAHLTGRDNERDALWARAHQQFLEAGNPPAAARAAFTLVMALMDRGDAAQAGGWLARAMGETRHLPPVA